MNTTEPRIDATEVVQNSLRLLFDALRPRRTLQADTVTIYLTNRWTVENEQRPRDPFWLTPPASYEAVELSDLLAYLLTESLPAGWAVRRNALLSPMTFGERSQLLQAFSHAAISWNMERGRFNPGLDEILRILSALTRSIANGKHLTQADASVIWHVLERLVDDLSAFPFAADDLNTVLDVGRAFDLWTSFVLSLPDRLPLASGPMVQSLLKLAARARDLMTAKLDTELEFTDIIYGSLLPWSRAADELLPSADAPLSLSIALSRFGSGSISRQGVRVGVMSTFPLDFDLQLGAPVRKPVLPQLRGPYSFARAIAKGDALSRELSKLSARRRNESPTPVPYAPTKLWTSTQPGDAIRVDDLELMW